MCRVLTYIVVAVINEPKMLSCLVGRFFLHHSLFFSLTVTHEVTLTSGDILFYESSKCFHGRPRPFNGTWYSSVFVHYYPTHGYKETFDEMGKVNRIPPHWADEPTSQYEIPLRMHGTTMEEPS